MVSLKQSECIEGDDDVCLAFLVNGPLRLPPPTLLGETLSSFTANRAGDKEVASPIAPYDSRLGALVDPRHRPLSQTGEIKITELRDAAGDGLQVKQDLKLLGRQPESTTLSEEL